MNTSETSQDSNISKEDLVKEIISSARKSQQNAHRLEMLRIETEEFKKELSRCKVLNTERKAEMESLKSKKKQNANSSNQQLMSLQKQLIEMNEHHNQEYIKLSKELQKKQTILNNSKKKLKTVDVDNQDEVDLNSALKEQVEDLNIKLCQMKEELQQQVLEVQELQKKFKETEETLIILKEKKENIKNSLKEENTLKDTLEVDLASMKLENQVLGNSIKGNLDGKPNSLFQEVDEGRVLQLSNYNAMKESIIEMINKKNELKKELHTLEMKSMHLTYLSKEDRDGKNKDDYLILRAYQDSCDLLPEVIKQANILIQDRKSNQLLSKPSDVLMFFNLCDQRDEKVSEWEKRATEEEYVKGDFDYKIFTAENEIQSLKEKVNKLKDTLTELNISIESMKQLE